MEGIKIDIRRMDPDQLQALAKEISRIAVQMFEDPEVRKQFDAWKKEREESKI